MPKIVTHYDGIPLEKHIVRGYAVGADVEYGRRIQAYLWGAEAVQGLHKKDPAEKWISMGKPYGAIHSENVWVKSLKKIVKNSISVKRHEKTPEPLRFQGFQWRGRRDLNPRAGFIQPTPLAGEPLRPLGYFRRS